MAPFDRQVANVLLHFFLEMNNCVETTIIIMYYMCSD